MARNDDRQRVSADSGAHGPRRAGLPDPPGHLCIRHGRTERDQLELGPDAALEGRPTDVEGQVECRELASEVRAELARDGRECFPVFRPGGVNDPTVAVVGQVDAAQARRASGTALADEEKLTDGARMA
jgi:hypothetical protein